MTTAAINIFDTKVFGVFLFGGLSVHIAFVALLKRHFCDHLLGIHDRITDLARVVAD